MSLDRLLEQGIDDIPGIPKGAEQAILDQAYRLITFINYEGSRAVDQNDLDELLDSFTPNENNLTDLDVKLQVIHDVIHKAQVKTEFPVATFLSCIFLEEDERSKKLSLVQGVVLVISYSLSKEHGYTGVYQRAMSSIRLLVERMDKRSYQKTNSKIFKSLPNFNDDAEKIYSQLNRLWENCADTKKDYGPLKVLFNKYVTGSLPVTRSKQSTVKASYGKIIRNKASLVTVEDENVELIEYKESVGSTKNYSDNLEMSADEGVSQRHIQVTMIAPESVQRSYLLKRRQARSAINQLVRREKHLSSEWSVLTEYEVSTVINICVEHFSSTRHIKYSYRYLMLMLFTGRSLSTLYAMLNSPDGVGQKFIKENSGKWWIEVMSSLPEHKVREDLEPLLRRSNKELLLSVHDYLQSHIEALKKDKRSFDKVKDGVDKVIREVNPVPGSRLTSNRISSYFSVWMRQKNIDPVLTNWLLGAELTVFEAGVYYTQLSQSHLKQVSDSYVGHLGVISNNSLVDKSPSKMTDVLIGSQLQIEERVIIKLFEVLRNRLSNQYSLVGSWKAFHNDYTLYTVLLMNLSSGHRPTLMPYQTVKHIDVTSGSLFIDDKAVGGSRYGRQIILPEVAFKQFKNYRDYICCLRDCSANIDREYENQFQKIVGGDFPLFFLIDKSRCKVVTPGLLAKKMKGILPLPLNIHRHFMRTKLSSLGVEFHLIDAWMGHSQFGHDSFETYSGLSLFDLKKVASVIDTYLTNHLNISAVKGPANIQWGAERIKRLTATSDIKGGVVRGRLHNQKVKAATEKIIRRNLAGLYLKEPRVDGYELGKDRVLQQLEDKFTGIKDYRLARNFFSIEINKGNRDGRWSLPIPEFIVSQNRSKPFRSYAWLKSVAELSVWRQLWLEKLSSKSVVDNLQLKELLASCLYSAMMHGGLCLSDAITALRLKLLNERKPFLKQGSHTWIDLVFDAKSQAINIKEGKTLRRWFPDPVSLALICQLLSRLKVTDKADVADLIAMDSWALLREYGNAIGGKDRFGFSSVEGVCRAAVGVAENLSDVDIPQALLEYSIGKTPAASLPAKQWVALLEIPDYRPCIVSFSDFKSLEIPKRKSSQQSNKSVNYEALISSIRLSLREKDGKGRKRTQKIAAKSLRNVMKESWGDNAYLLLDWLHSLLVRDRLALSSVSRYYSAIGRHWIAETAEQSMSEWGAEEFELLYESILDLAKTDRARYYNIGRLEELHRHGVGLLGFPIVSLSEQRSVGTARPRVRSGIVNEALFQTVLKSISLLGDVDEHTRQALSLVSVISCRLGLRLGEVLKLRLCDVEPSEGRWLFIRNNKYGNNKTLSSRRKVPLWLLLLPGEKLQFESYFQRQRAIAKNNDLALLFSLPQSPADQLDSQQVSRLIGYKLSTISGEKYVFHHLRHTAITRLYYLLDCYDKNDCIEVGYSHDQIQVIRDFYSVSDKTINKDLYWTIAGLVGHSTPAASFNSYIHLADYSLGAKLAKTSTYYARDEVKALTGWGEYKIKQLVKSSGGDGSISVRDIKRDIIERCNKYAKQLKLNVPSQKSISRTRRVGLGIDLCHDVLRAIENGSSVDEAAADYSIDTVIVWGWYNNAVTLTELKTRKKKSRFIASNRKPAISGKIIVPPKPRSNIEKRQTKKALENLRALYPNNKDEIRWCVSYHAERVNTKKAGISFNEMADLLRFLEVFLQVDSPSNWAVVIYGNERKRIQNIDRKLIEAGLYKSKISYEYKSGSSESYRLYWNKYGSKKDKTYKRYSTSAFRYLIFMLSVMMS